MSTRGAAHRASLPRRAESGIATDEEPTEDDKEKWGLLLKAPNTLGLFRIIAHGVTNARSHQKLLTGTANFTPPTGGPSRQTNFCSALSDSILPPGSSDRGNALTLSTFIYSFQHIKAQPPKNPRLIGDSAQFLLKKEVPLPSLTLYDRDVMPPLSTIVRRGAFKRNAPNVSQVFCAPCAPYT